MDNTFCGKKVEQVIDEKKLIEELNRLATSNEMMGYLTAFDVVQDCIGIVEKQPQIEKCADCTRRKFYQQGYQDGLNADKWIPVEERLPSEYGQYLYTDKNDEVHEGCYCPPLQGMVRGWSTCEADGFVKLSDEEVIAWTNLPQPYKKEGAENE